MQLVKKEEDRKMETVAIYLIVLGALVTGFVGIYKVLRPKKEEEKQETEKKSTGRFYHSFSKLVGELGSDNYETIIHVDDEETGISYCYALKGAKIPERTEEEVRQFFGLK